MPHFLTSVGTQSTNWMIPENRIEIDDAPFARAHSDSFRSTLGEKIAVDQETFPWKRRCDQSHGCKSLSFLLYLCPS